MARIRHLVSFLIGYCLFQVLSALAWQKKPQSQSVALGGNVTFNCEIEDRGSRVVIWHDSSYTILFNNKDRFNAPPRYSIQGEFNLVITNITKEDNRQFICNVKDLGLEAANLTVLLPPNPPSITANATGNLFTENQVLALTCSSSGGNPNPAIRWLKNGQVQVDNIINNPAPTIGGVSTSRISIVLDRTDHQANYTCIVSNQVNEQNPLSTFRELQVRYSPYITFAPYNPLNVRLDRDASLECIVDANPPVSTVQWRKNGQILSGSSPARVFRPAIKSDTGEYMCIANNGVSGPRNASLVLSVVYPPLITIPETEIASEAQRVDILCSIDANPEPYQVHWERVGSGQTPVQNGRRLLFNRIRREDAGNYTCKAWSQLKISGESNQNVMEQAFTYIHVEYPPGGAFIKPIGDYNVGDTVELKCSASPEGYPAATYEWEKNGIVQSQTSATYRISSAQLSDIGEYSCTPVNKVGRGQSRQISLSVNEPPRLTEGPNNAEIHVPLSDEKLLEIKCVARGRPSPVITWFKNNDDANLTTLYPSFYTIQQSNRSVDEHSFQITNVLYFRGGGRNMTVAGRTHLRVEDIGNYTCRVESQSHTERVSGRASVFVQFKPQVTGGERRVAVDKSSTASLPCITYANPDPSFTWYRNNVQITDGGRFSTRIEKLDQTAKFQSVLSISQVQDADLGPYTCIVRNSFGNVTKPVRLSWKSAPESPQYLMYVSRTWESVALDWKAGFNGGETQQFYVQYSVGEVVRDVAVIPMGATSFNVTRLTPHTSYLFFVYGKNSLGKGSLSNGTLVQTEELIIPPLGTTPSFNAETNILNVKVAMHPTYCLKVEIRTTQSGSKWQIAYPCLEMVSELIEVTEPGITAMNLSVCLRSRRDVCGAPTQVEINQPAQGLTERDVIIIACVCAVIIVTLLTILVCFICKRKRNQAKDYEQENAARRAQTINGSVTNPQKPPQAYDNTDGPLELKRNGHIPNRGGHLQPNGNVPHDTSYDSQLEKQIFENEMNRRNENNSKSGRPGELHFHGIPRSPTKDKYVDIEEKKDGSLQSGVESGYSTPDPNKPKKKPKLKHMKSNIYYSDFARFEHDPPGHTCGLPCCVEDANVNIKQPSSGYSCMPVHEKITDDNFTFRIKRYGLISGRPTFSNKFFSLQNINSDEMSKQRGPIPDFNENKNAGNKNEMRERPRSLEFVLTDRLEDPFVLIARPGLRKGEYMCRREICLPDSPDMTRKIVFSDYDMGESLDFEEEEDGTIEYYTTTPQNAIKIDTAPIKVLNKSNQDGERDLKGCHDNKAFTQDPDDSSEIMTSSEHYYDVLSVVNGDKGDLPPPPPRMYPDLSEIKEEEERKEEFSFFKQKYIPTLARKKSDSRPVSIPVTSWFPGSPALRCSTAQRNQKTRMFPVSRSSNKYDTFPCRKTPLAPTKPPATDDKMKRFHLWNQLDPNTDNYYEDIEFKQPDNKETKDDVKMSDDVTNKSARNSFGSFGYDGDKSPSKPVRMLEKKAAEMKEETSKRQDSLKDSPITLIL